MQSQKPHLIQRLILLTLLACTAPSFAGHPGEETGMVHPSVAIPQDAAIPSIRAKLSPDLMEGFNLELKVRNFHIVVPHADTPDLRMANGKEVLQGHIHLYVNGKKRMRVYGEAIHIPSDWLKQGINSLIVSINNHMHGTYTSDEREIQTTLIFEYGENVTTLIKSEYSWPRNHPNKQ